MKHDKKRSFDRPTTPTPDAAALRTVLARSWKPETSSLKREDWRRIVMERIG